MIVQKKTQLNAWEKVMIYTPYHFVFSLSRENYIKMKLETCSNVLDEDTILEQAENFNFVSEDLRMLDWSEVAKYLKFETYLDSEASDILYSSVYKSYPQIHKQKHRLSIVEKRMKLMKLLGKKEN